MISDLLISEVEQIREKYLNKWFTNILERPVNTLSRDLENLGWFLSIEPISYSRTVYRLTNPKKQLSNSMILDISVSPVSQKGIGYYQHINVSVSYL